MTLSHRGAWPSSRLRIALLLAVTTIYAVPAAAPNAAIARWLNSVNPERMKADIQFLSSDELRGRETLSPESRIAGRWLATEYERYGLKPMGEDGSYFQSFTVASEVRDPGRTGLLVEMPGKDGPVVKDYTRGGAQRPEYTETDTTGPVVFAGYGITAPEYNYDDYAGLDVRGKIVMVLSHEPAEDRDDPAFFKGTWNTRYAYRLYKQQVAQEKGALGMIMVEESRRHAPPPKPDPDRIRRGPETPVETLAALPLVPLTYVSEGRADEILQASGKKIADLRRQIDTSLRPQSFALEGLKATIRIAERDRHTIVGRNVVGLLEGSDPKLKDEVVVITAHYDHLGTRDTHIFHGADDNASGAATLLETMRVYRQNNIRPRRSILFVAFEAEELLMVGSYGYVLNPPVPLAKTIAQLNCDMVGRDEDTYRAKPEDHRNSVNIVGTLYSPQLRTVVERANRSVGLTLDYKMDKDDSENMFGRSDQYPFAMKNVPEVLFMTGFHPDYHTSRDTWDKINYPKLTKIARLVFLTSLDLANASGRPKFVP